MIKKVTTIIKSNKKDIQKRAIVIAGTALGAFIAGVVIAKEEPLDVTIVEEDDVVTETTEEPAKED